MIVHKGEVDDEGEGVCDDMLGAMAMEGQMWSASIHRVGMVNVLMVAETSFVLRQ